MTERRDFGTIVSLKKYFELKVDVTFNTVLEKTAMTLESEEDPSCDDIKPLSIKIYLKKDRDLAISYLHESETLEQILGKIDIAQKYNIHFRLAQVSGQVKNFVIFSYDLTFMFQDIYFSDS